MLELRNIKKSYHSRLVLQKPSLQLEKGIYWIKGSNGSGKTTLLKMIAGLLPFEGDILYNGISLKNNPITYRRCTSWAEAEPLYPHFISGIDLVCLYQNIRKVQQREIDELLKIFNVTEFIDDSIGTYSAGMTKKLSLVLAFMGNAPLCILDEPLITLDADAFDAVCKFILESHKNNKTTFLLSSHQDLNTQLILAGKELLINNQDISFIE